MDMDDEATMALMDSEEFKNRPVIVTASDLKHLLDVYIDNGMVEAEDEPIINRLYAIVTELGDWGD